MKPKSELDNLEYSQQTMVIKLPDSIRSISTSSFSKEGRKYFKQVIPSTKFLLLV